MSNSEAFTHTAEEAGMILRPLELAETTLPEDKTHSGLIGLPESQAMSEQIMQVLGE